MTLPLPSGPRAKGEQVWLIGDSLGVGLLKPLRAQAAAAGVKLDGSPVGGTSVAHWTNGSIYVANIDAVLKWPATTVLVSLGTNDAINKVAPNIRLLVEHLRSNGARVIWLGPPETGVAFAPKTIAAIQQQCAELDVEYIDSRGAKFQHAPGDRIHASPAGYATWAAWLWPRIGIAGGSSVGWVLAGTAATLLAGWAAYTVARKIRS